MGPFTLTSKSHPTTVLKYKPTYILHWLSLFSLKTEYIDRLLVRLVVLFSAL